MVQGDSLSSLTVSDLYTLLRPKECELRVYLRAKGEPEGDPSPYEEVIRKLGMRHEENHLASLQNVTDLSSGSLEERAQKTRQAIQSGVPVIYQGVFQVETEVSGSPYRILGIPDFLIREGSSYIIRDSKIARRITLEDHPEIFHSVKLYGWLFEKSTGLLPVRLEVFSGKKELVILPQDDSCEEVFSLLQKITALRSLEQEPYSPVGWTKCGICGFKKRCWEKAEEGQDVAILVGVDRNLAGKLHLDEILTIDDLIAKFSETELSEYKYPWGKSSRRVGKATSGILHGAKAVQSGQEFWIKKPEIPGFKNYVMFDLEGLPPQLNDLDKIYLWGMQVFGEEPGEYTAALAGFGPEGDEGGWKDFLKKANEIFNKYGDIPFVHWTSYEKTFVNRYIKRFGDVEGIAQRVLNNLLDLHPVATSSVVLPLPSYSLKVIEKHVGFKRTQDEYGGDWSMAKYIEATELEDDEEREKIMGQILLYNKEDLEATWAVFQWLNSKVYK